MDSIIKAGAQSPDAPFTFVLSTEDVDRMGDVVVQGGISLAAFKKNPVALFAHNARQPIGTWENIRRDGERLIADLKLAARGTSRMIDEVRSLLEQRILRAASIGFGIVKAEPIDADRPYAGIRYLKTELMEASLVAVPANPNALALRSLSAELRALFLADATAGIDANATPARAAHAATQPAANQGTRHMNIAERMKGNRARLVEIDKRTGELQAVAETVETLSPEHTQEIETLTGERKTVEGNIASLTALESLIGQRAEPVAGAPAIIHARTRGSAAFDAEPKGTLIARIALAHVLAHVEHRPIVDIVRERFGHDQRVEGIILRSHATVADTSTPGWAKELVRQDVQGFVDTLKPLSVYAAMASRGFVVDFGDAGSVSVPYRGGASTDLAGAFVGENGVIPVKRTTIGANVLNRYKMAVITTLTKELARTSTPQAEALLRRFIAEDTAVALDHAFLDASPAVAGTRPAGILNGVAAIAPSAAATPVEKAIADLKGLVNALIATGNGVRPVFLMNPAQSLSLSVLYSAGIFLFREEIANGRVMGVEVVTSANVPVGDIVLIDAANFATGLGTPEFDASDTATLVMANADAVKPTHATNPADDTAVGTAEQVPPDGGIKVNKADQRAAGMVGENAVVMSMYQQWGIALRSVLPVSWGLTRAGSVVWVDAVTW